MGDSHITANGIFSNEPIHSILEFRGVSYPIGGLEDWRKFMTLPNLIKVYNPNVYGQTEVPSAMFEQKEKKFGVAESGM